jgi:hypothetical protein
MDLFQASCPPPLRGQPSAVQIRSRRICLRVRCETCHEERLVAFSCTNSRRFRRYRYCSLQRMRWHCQGNTQWPKRFVGHAERSRCSRGRPSPRRRTAVSKTLRRCPLHSLQPKHSLRSWAGPRSRGRLSSRYLHTWREERNQKNSTRCPRAGHRPK